MKKYVRGFIFICPWMRLLADEVLISVTIGYVVVVICVVAAIVAPVTAAGE